MVDKIALGRQGEIFVMQKLMDKGWKFPSNYHEKLDGLDWVFEKEDRIIKIQVKTSLKNKSFSCQGIKSFDYLIFTDLIDIFVIPIEMLKVSDKLNKTCLSFFKFQGIVIIIGK